MIIRVIYDPKGAWESHWIEADSLSDMDLPKELQEGDLLITEPGKRFVSGTGAYDFFEMQGGKLIKLENIAHLRGSSPPVAPLLDLDTLL